MKNLTLLILLILSFATKLVSQDSLNKLDYALYEPNEQRYHIVDYEGFGSAILKRGYFNNSFLVTGLSVNNTMIRNSKKWQVSSQVQVGIRNLTRSQSFATASVSHTSRFYPFEKHKNLYIPIDAEGVMNYRSRDFHNHRFKIATGAGYGRVKILNEVEISERIISELVPENIQTKKSSNDIFLLANYLTELKNERLITNRDNLTEEFKLIKNLLEELGYKTESAHFDEAISKIYGKEPLVLREEGKILSMKIGHQFASFTNGINENSTQDSNEFILSLENKKYVNSKFQWNTSIYFGLGESHPLLDLPLWRSSEFVNGGINSSFYYLPNIDKKLMIGVDVMVEKNKLIFENDINETSGYSFRVELEYEKRFKRNLRVAVGLEIFGYDYGNPDLMPIPKVRVSF